MLQSNDHRLVTTKEQTPKDAQLLVELRFILEHSIEARKVTLKEYFSLLRTFNRQGEAKKLKDYFHQTLSDVPLKSRYHEAILELFLRVCSEYESIYLDTSQEMLWKLIDLILFKLSDFQYCTQCYDWQLVELPRFSKFSLKNSKDHYYCTNCQEEVAIFRKFDLFPVFLEYLVNLSEDGTRYKKVKKNLFKFFGGSHSAESKQHQNVIILFYEIFEDAYEFACKRKNIKQIRVLWNVGQKLNFQYVFKKFSTASFISDYIVGQIENGDFSDYAICLDLIQKIYEKNINPSNKYYLRGGIEKNILKSISTCNFATFNHSLEFGIQNDLISEDAVTNSPHFNAACIRGLYYALQTSQLDKFETLFDIIQKYQIGLDLHDIPNRNDLLGNLIFHSLNSKRFDQIFSILQFGKNYQLFEQIFPKPIDQMLDPSRSTNIGKFDDDITFDDLTSDHPALLIKSLKNNAHLMENLRELIGYDRKSELTKLLEFLYIYFPHKIFDYFEHTFNFYVDQNEMIDYISDFIDNFTFYGLSIKKIGYTSHFFRFFNKLMDSDPPFDDVDEIEIEFANRHILISKSNIVNIHARIQERPRKYEFPLLGMVLQGGLGPQGYGFVYFTPRGELVEVCSDSDANQAYIVHFKQFLKDDFIEILESRLKTLNLSLAQKEHLIGILDGRLGENQIIGYTKEEFILHQIRDFLEDEFDFRRLTSQEKHDLFGLLQQKIHSLLMPITLVDQYRCRLDLVSRGQVHPGEIAKLTSLGAKSHYDVLIERYFYQTIIQFMRKNTENDFPSLQADYFKYFDMI